ncbi:MAG: hypothetical protein ACR2HG_04310 [Pyrinomonadaceae bacterium]
MSYKNTPFYVGGYYRDRKRGYEVLDMSDNGMKIKYDDGTIETLNSASIKLKANIYNNILAEYRFTHLSDTDAYFWTLGFLSVNGRFDAEIPNKAMQNFLDQYKQLTGERVSSNHAGISSLGEVDKWGPELRIYFPITDKTIDLGSDAIVRDGQTSNVKRINNNSIWNKLIRVGFRLGQNHDIEQIKKSIPKDKLAVFENGQR